MVTGPVSYMVQLENGEMWHQHIDHLRPGSVIPSTEKDTEGGYCPILVVPENPLQPTPNAPADLTIPTQLNNDYPRSNSNEVPNQEAPQDVPSSQSRYPTRNHNKPNRLYGALST